MIDDQLTMDGRRLTVIYYYYKMAFSTLCDRSGICGIIVMSVSLDRPFLLNLFFTHSIPYTRIPGTWAYGADVCATGPSEKYGINSYCLGSFLFLYDFTAGPFEDPAVQRMSVQRISWETGDHVPRMCSVFVKLREVFDWYMRELFESRCENYLKIWIYATLRYCTVQCPLHRVESDHWPVFSVSVIFRNRAGVKLFVPCFPIIIIKTSTVFLRHIP